MISMTLPGTRPTLRSASSRASADHWFLSEPRPNDSESIDETK